MLTWLQRDNLAFPPLDLALREPNGLLAAGGDLSPERLLAAYRHGCFPWYQEGQPLLWWSPDPRTVLYPDELHVSRSLRKRIRQGCFRITFDQAFAEVMDGCAGPRNYTRETWITSQMKAAYLKLHGAGVAHSVEVWQGEQLVGGLYGLAIGKLFFGESMFSHVSDASKVGFVTLVERLQEWEFKLVDCQMPTQHLANFGARTIPRKTFAKALADYLDQPEIAAWKTVDS